MGLATRKKLNRLREFDSGEPQARGYVDQDGTPPHDHPYWQQFRKSKPARRIARTILNALRRGKA